MTNLASNDSASFSIQGSAQSNSIYVDAGTSTISMGAVAPTWTVSPDQYLGATGTWQTGYTYMDAPVYTLRPSQLGKTTPVLQVDSGEVLLKGNAVLKLEAADSYTEKRVPNKEIVEAKDVIKEPIKKDESSGFPLILGLLALGGAVMVKASAKKARAVKKEVQKA